MRLSSIRLMGPSQRRRLCLRRVNIKDTPALSSTALLVKWFFHEIPRMRLRQRMWKVLSLFSCPEWGVHDSLPYRSVDTTQAMYT